MDMAQDIININIKYGEGISQAIDRRLDKEFNQDVKFNLVEWNSVFNVIKNDTADSTKQYSGGDEDIQNNKNYVVQEGNYQITKNAWQQILDLAKKSLGITDAKTEEKVAEDNAAVEESTGEKAQVAEEKTQATEEKAQSTEEKIKTILTNSGIDVDNISEEDMAKIKSKYEMICIYNKQNNIETNDEVLQERIVNYTKGLRFQNFEKQVLEKDGLAEYESDCSKAKTVDELRSMYKQFGKEYVETMDQDGNGQIDAHELFLTELTAQYERKGMSSLAARKKALGVVDEFKNYNAMNLPQEGDALYGTDDAEKFVSILLNIGVLDKDKNMSLSSDEAAAYLMAMAQLNDSKNNITRSESTKATMAIATNDMSAQEIIDEFGYSEEFANTIVSFRERFNNNLQAAQEFIIENGELPM